MLRNAMQSSLLILIGGLSLGFIGNQNAAAALETNLRRSPITQPTPTPLDAKSSYNGYKGVTIGMSAADARAKLGAPKEKSDEQDYYVFSENESAQVLYESDHTVKVISINYIGK